MKMISWQKKIIFSMLLAIIGYIILEIFSFTVYYLTQKQIFSFSKVIRLAKQISISDNITPLNAQGTNAIALHPYLGFVYNPEINSDGFVSFHKHPVSPYGFIDDAPPFYVKSNNRVIIGVFGGSVAYWFSAYAIDTLLSELKTISQFSDKEIVIVRVALGGYKQPQQLLALNYLLALGAEFDIIINIDGFNEIALPPTENVPKNVFPFYPRNWFFSIQEIKNHNLLSNLYKIQYLRNERIKWATSFLNTHFHYSVTVSLIWILIDHYVSSELAQSQIQLQQYQTNKSEISYVQTGVLTHYINESEMYKDLARVWKNCSLQMNRLSTANNIRYFHFLQPNQYVPNSKIMKEEELKIAFLNENPYKQCVEKGYPFLKTISKELTTNGVNFFDLSMVFTANDEILYNDQCCHFNQRGNQLLGKIIGKHIVDNFNGNQ